MPAFPSTFLALADLYLAYRKAKVEAFYESSHFSALVYARYEANLDKNLRALLKRLRESPPSWPYDPKFIGDYVYAPKSVEDVQREAALHYRALDPLEDWKQCFQRRKGKRMEASFRLLIVASVDFQIISALWIVKVGARLDACLDSRYSYGNRLRQTIAGDLNKACIGLFAPYFSDYRRWRERGLEAMRHALQRDEQIVAVTMDIRQFYHRVSPDFLLRRGFLAELDIKFTAHERRLTRHLIDSIHTWYQTTPDYSDRPEGALPVGLSASKVIANVLLKQFDESVASRLSAIYYGRYVDDIFLVLKHPPDVYSGSDFVEWIGEAMSPLLRVEKSLSEEAPSLRLRMRYARDADLVFAGEKQKIFNLSADYGSDLVERIAEKIREQSSEYRLLPELPSTNVEMAARALLATPDATLEADALRKADAVSIRRLGFSLLLRDTEAYEKDLTASAWTDLRGEFYGLVQRHLLTPRGFFDYASYFHRVFGLMIACRDFVAARTFLVQLRVIVDLVETTTTAGSTEAHKFARCRDYYARGLLQAAMQASTVPGFTFDRRFTSTLKLLRSIGMSPGLPATVPAARSMGFMLLCSDWGRRPYKHHWFYGPKNAEELAPPVPRSIAVRRQLRVGAIRRFQRFAELRTPYWPALAFPTRLLTIAEMVMIAPRLLNDERYLRQTVMGLRGARVADSSPIGFYAEGVAGERYYRVPAPAHKSIIVAVTSVETTDTQWKAAAKGRADLSLKRYRTLRGLVNRLLKDVRRPTYVVFPELSVPRKWAIGMANKLGQHGISLLAGVEYYSRRRKYRNDCLVSLSSRWPGYLTNIITFQPKLRPSHEERRQLKKHKRILYEPIGADSELPIYVHGKLFFGILLCSDLTNIDNRKRFQGQVDALIILEWNSDLTTFGFLVEATAHDVHAFVVQVNNRQYGDSRFRGPFRVDYKRDVVRVKGGISDYYVLAKLEYERLRVFQRTSGSRGDGEFKPTPVGFEMSPQRRHAKTDKV